MADAEAATSVFPGTKSGLDRPWDREGGETMVAVHEPVPLHETRAKNKPLITSVPSFRFSWPERLMNVGRLQLAVPWIVATPVVGSTFPNWATSREIARAGGAWSTLSAKCPPALEPKADTMKK